MAIVGLNVTLEGRASLSALPTTFVTLGANLIGDSVLSCAPVVAIFSPLALDSCVKPTAISLDFGKADLLALVVCHHTALGDVVRTAQIRASLGDFRYAGSPLFMSHNGVACFVSSTKQATLFSI